MKAIFIFDVDKNEYGEAVAMITKEDYTTFFARGVIRPLPSKRRKPFTKTFGTPYNIGKAEGYNRCLDEILGETNG